MMDMTSHGKGSQSMDARLWSQLQNHIDLAMVYVKLPIGDFFRLRQVCKEWNRLASDRGFLEETFRDPIPKPYFVVGTWKMNSRLVTQDGSSCSRRWSSTRVPYSEFQVEGVFKEDFYSRRVFNVHTRVICDPPPPPKTVPAFPSPLSGSSDDSSVAPWDPLDHEPLMGMTVDTSVRPYTFQIFLGDWVIETRIYDSSSNSWTYNLSYLSEVYYETHRKPSCAQCNGFLYIRVWKVPDGSGIDLHVYDLKREEWMLNSPSIPDDEWGFCDIGAWQDRLFFFGVKRSQSSCAVIAFELSNHSEDSWTVFDRMPDELCLYMLAGPGEKFDDHTSLGTMDMMSIFCGEYVLVYNCVGLDEVTERAVLYNLDHKTWETVDLPSPHRLLWWETGNGLTIGLRNAVRTRRGASLEPEGESEWESEESEECDLP